MSGISRGTTLAALSLTAVLVLTLPAGAGAQPVVPIDPSGLGNGVSSLNPGPSAANAIGPVTEQRIPAQRRPGPTGRVIPPPPPGPATGGKGPVGYDVYRRLDELPALTSGVQTLQFSSYDRTGGNDDGFFGRYSCLRETSQECVIAEHTGPGEIDSIWFTRDGGDVSHTGAIRIELDGRTVLDAPLQDVVDGKLGGAFRYPLVANADLSSGGVYIKVPMPFRQSMKISTATNPYFYHVTYRAFADAVGVPTFDPSDPAEDVLNTLLNAGYADPKPAQPGARRITASVSRLPAGATTVLGRITGPGSITQLRLRVPRLTAGVSPLIQDLLDNVRLRITFDGMPTVDAPLRGFFATGLGDTEVRSLFFAAEPAVGGWYTSWWPMPYARSAVVELANASAQPIGRVDAEITHVPSATWAAALGPTGSAGYFHAEAHRNLTSQGRDWRVADDTGSGRFLGVTATASAVTPIYSLPPDNPRSYLEGDEHVYVDGAATPQISGTGTEDFFEGGWYFNRGTFTNPLNGNTAHGIAGLGCALSCDSMYRIMLGDAIPWQSSLCFGLEHGPVDNAPAVYDTVAFSYRRPADPSVSPADPSLSPADRPGAPGSGRCSLREPAAP